MCYNLDGLSVEIMTVYFCIIFYSVGDRPVIIGYPYRHAGTKILLYVKLYEYVRKLWAISYGTYVQKQRNTQDFIIESIICSCINIG